MVRYYGYYSNVSRGKRKKENLDKLIPCILQAEESSKKHRKNWARLIQKIYEVDLLTCAKCQGRMRIISFIEDEEVIKKILKHLGLWDLKARPPPHENALHKTTEHHLDYSRRGVDPSGPEADSQLPPADDYLYIDLGYPETFSS